jgi:hypothetical protein
MKTFSPKNLTRQAGVSLAETMIVTVVIGALSVLTYSQFGNSSTLVKAKTTYDTAEKIAQSWSYITGVLDSTPNITTISAAVEKVPGKDGAPDVPAKAAVVSENPILSTNSTALDAVVTGNFPSGIIRDTYSATYVTSGIRPLLDIINTITAPKVLSSKDKKGGVGEDRNENNAESKTITKGVYSINGYPVTLSTTTDDSKQLRILVSLSNVPSEVAGVLWSSKNTETAYNRGFAQGTSSLDKISHSAADASNMVSMSIAFQP